MRSLWPIVFAIIESSALYALAILSAFISLLTGCQWEHPAVGAIIPFVVSSDVPLALRPDFNLRLGHLILSYRSPDPLPRRFNDQQPWS